MKIDGKEYKIIPVVVLRDEEDAKAQLSALSAGGLPVAEITFRTEYAASGIAYCRKNFPDIVVGAGTVVNAAQAEKALQAGARFIVSPGLDEAVAERCKKAGISYLPGCVTPTEIMQALRLGITTVKFFPANVYGGLSAIKALSAPFPQVKFVPTGGVDGNNLREFLSFDKIAAIGGSWMLKGTTEERLVKIQNAVQTAEKLQRGE